MILSAAELRELTGYKRAAEQLAELHRQGFARARRDRLGHVILERSHYDAVCQARSEPPRPKVRLQFKAA